MKNTIERINMNIEREGRIRNEKIINEQNRRYELCRKITNKHYVIYYLIFIHHQRGLSRLQKKSGFYPILNIQGCII